MFRPMPRRPDDITVNRVLIGINLAYAAVMITILIAVRDQQVSLVLLVSFSGLMALRSIVIEVRRARRARHELGLTP